MMYVIMYDVCQRSRLPDVAALNRSITRRVRLRRMALLKHFANPSADLYWPAWI